MRKLTYFIAASIDGFIAAPDGSAECFMSWVGGEFLEYLKTEAPDTLPTHVRPAFGIEGAGNRLFDTVIQGRTTYQPALDIGVTSPYAHLRQYVVSRTLDESPDPAVEIVSGDLVAKVRELKAEEGGLGIWLAGGADVVGQLVDEIDEVIVKTYPLFLGSGVPMSRAGFEARAFTLDAHQAFDNGVSVATYRKRR
ncbi:dihydrofolate reductase family protein [Streptomyces sp. NPDC050504]|uniref:dihydrofolate reductase family protein n=1 Tax=Streptomyces sp. NPDC050504 TaxID=3365618 RepID=UPI003791A7B4